MAEKYSRRDGNGHTRKNRGIASILIQLAASALIIYITSLLVPGFSGLGLVTALLAAVVISLLDYFVHRLFNIEASPFGKGISGFLLSALIIYIAQFIVPGMKINILGAVLASLVIGVIDAIIPGKSVY